MVKTKKRKEQYRPNMSGATGKTIQYSTFVIQRLQTFVENFAKTRL